MNTLPKGRRAISIFFRTPYFKYRYFENTKIFSLAPPKLSRHSNTCKYDDLLEPSEVSDPYEVSEVENSDYNDYNDYNFESAPYLTPTATQIMRSVSENTDHVRKFHFYLSDDTDNDDNDTKSTNSLFYSP